MEKKKNKNWKKYGFEFLSIFIAVISAFALNNWNENRKDSISESKILAEIANGLEKDLIDIKLNIRGHKEGIAACQYFAKAFAGKDLATDSLMQQFFNLTRNFVSIQNTAGFETLKSKGLELIKNDSLRHKIISLYEYDYNILQKLEEEYSEMQFQENYFKEINKELAPNFIINNDGVLTGINNPLVIKPCEKNKLFLYLWKIQSNRVFILQYYSEIEEKIHVVKEYIIDELKP